MSSPNEKQTIANNEESVEIELIADAEQPVTPRADERQEGRVLVPALLWMAGVPFGVVLLLWFFFFRG